MAPGSDLFRLKERVASAKDIVVLTGAGISADSGVPTFRGKDGLWRTYRAEDLATPEAFERDPQLVWEWYNWRREMIAAKRPNPAHHAVVELEQRYLNFWLITQNVDGLHRDAGSQKLSEIHGNIWMVRCTVCRHVFENRDVPVQILPKCHDCDGLLRPHIVWFGESLADEDLRRSYAALRSCSLCLIIGTSGLVYPAAGFASVAKESGAFVAEINLDPTPQSALFDVSLQGRAKDIVPLLLDPIQ
ncbi:MAG: NAD-dependent deacylase [Nitrospira sp.]|jgi:NAD-dependent deacetylase|nr:NAD-dependent deacylase [Nitrospira sp.]MDH4243454.1 NAD-dependent deacylase [Nitrospira sp.]MDH4357819.1 NAD-dependent deacylase [Nitrospira sp.]MDH5316843.1 NAD-dependent deacylase [Nitrospira sp.]